MTTPSIVPKGNMKPISYPFSNNSINYIFDNPIYLSKKANIFKFPVNHILREDFSKPQQQSYHCIYTPSILSACINVLKRR